MWVVLIVYTQLVYQKCWYVCLWLAFLCATLYFPSKTAGFGINSGHLHMCTRAAMIHTRLWHVFLEYWMLNYHIPDLVTHLPRAKCGISVSYQDPLWNPYLNQFQESIILLPDWCNIGRHQSNTGRDMGPLLGDSCKNCSAGIKSPSPDLTGDLMSL